MTSTVKIIKWHNILKSSKEEEEQHKCGLIMALKQKTDEPDSHAQECQGKDYSRLREE